VRSNNRTENLLGALALALTDEMQAEFTRVAGQQHNAVAAIVSIGIAPGISIDALAKILQLSHSATVRLADRLDGDGLIVRERADKDRRSVSLRLTPEGTALRQNALQARSGTLKRALADLSSTDLAALTRLLEALLSALTMDRAAADHTCRLCDEEICPEASCPVERAARRSEAPT